MAENKTRAAFVEPMLLLRTESLPEGKAWLYELKFDGYRALAIKSAGELYLRSRNGNDFNVRYPGIVKGLSSLPDDTVVDGEVVALDTHGKLPSICSRIMARRAHPCTFTFSTYSC